MKLTPRGIEFMLICGQIRFTIPETTPPGQYLLRMEQIYPWPNRSNTQMFVECAQVDVKGVGGGTPGPLVHLQDYISMDPAVPGMILNPLDEDFGRGRLRAMLISGRFASL